MVQSKATSVAAYLRELPAERRHAIAAVRELIRANVDADIEEGMTYGMIGYYVPHDVYPAGYHCDPKQPLPYAGLASQKNHMSVYLMGLYTEPEDAAWFERAWRAAGKKLDMGKCCVRFKRLEDVPMDVLAEAFRRMPSKRYIAAYEARFAGAGRSQGKAVARKAVAKKDAKKAAKKTAKKTAKK